MADRRRFAIVAAPLLALLAALLLGWSVASAQAPDPLTLTITAERSECTAGTLNPVSWEISGGTPPYTLTIDGAPVEADAESATVTCGALPDGASEAPGTITAVVRDSAGSTAMASAAYTVVEPLPAPTKLRGNGFDREIWLRWHRWGGGDPQPKGTWTSACRCQRYLLRWRIAGTDTWTTSLVVIDFTDEIDRSYSIEGLDAGATFEVAIAKVWDSIERETPEALLWSAPVQITTFAPPRVEAIATHDTITVKWVPQPGVKLLGVRLDGPDHRGSREFTQDDGIPDQVVFRRLPPDTPYTLQVWIEVRDTRLMTETSVETVAAPAEWRTLPRGPQNLRTTVTRNSVVVDWDAPYAGADDVYTVTLTRRGDLVEEAIVSGGVTRYTFTGLAPAMRYEVEVTHSDIVSQGVLVPIKTLARAGALLRLTLLVEREQCTEGTFTPVTWTITGGTAPYSLTVAGEHVAADEGTVTVPCGELRDDRPTLPATIEARVADDTGAMSSATAGYMIVPPFHGPLFSERAAGVEPLSLTLTAVRAECTEGTLNPIVWTITGGTPPDTLTINEALVNPDAERTTVTCGNLPDGATEASEAITAVVTDADGATVTASAAYAIVPPLPAPTGLGHYAERTEMSIWWDRVAAAGPVPTGSECPCPLYLVRWRVAGTSTWEMALHPDQDAARSGPGRRFYGLSEGTTYEWAVAALRDAIEQETPAGLTWSPTVTATTVAPPTGVRATATHDTITVTWDPQPGARSFSVSVRAPGSGDSQSFTPDGDAPHRVVFRHLPPGTEYTVRVLVNAGYESPSTQTTVRTSAPPPDWEPLPRGPQNVRTSVTYDSITVRWDPPFPEAHDYYRIFLQPRTEQIVPFSESSQSGSASGGVTEYTFRGLGPDSTYEITVSHAGVVFEEVGTTVTTAPWLPPPAETPVLPYERFDRKGRALTPGSYAFLDGAGRPVTTYQALRDGTTTGLRVHLVDADGASRADSFGAAAVGDIFEWRQAEDCWVRYQVTALLPGPSGNVPRKNFAIRWVTYAATGCGGAIVPDAAVRFQWRPAPIVSGNITSPVHHGPYVLHPPDWEGDLPEQVEITLPEPPRGTPPTRSDDNSLWPSRDLDVVRQHPLWRVPDLPEGWTLSWARAQNGRGEPYDREGVFVESHYRDADGASAMSIVVALIARRPTNIAPTTGISGGGIFELRVIDGHAALLHYNPTGASYNPAGFDPSWTFVIIFDATTSVGYNVSVYPRNFVELDDVIAIARSLYR